MSAQTIVLIIGILRTALIPMMLGDDLTGYAQWQTYLLYLGYISIAYFGFNDGLYIRHARLAASEVQHRLRSTFALYFLALSLEAILLIGVALILYRNSNTIGVWVAIFANLPITGIYGALLYHLQLTGRIDRASLMVVADKTVFVAAVGVTYLLGELHFIGLLIADIASKVAVVGCASIVEWRSADKSRFSISLGWRELTANMAVGTKVMVGSYSALLLGGVPRVIVERFHPSETFAHFAFAFSVTGILLLGGPAVASVIYPRLARAPIPSLGGHFRKLNRTLLLAFPLILLVYVPVEAFVQRFLPQYQASLEFLPLMLVAGCFQLVISALNNTFYRLLRLESRMLRENVTTLAVMIVVGILLRNDIFMMLVGQVVVLAFRVFLTQRHFARHMEQSPGLDTIVELVLGGVFVGAVSLRAGFSLVAYAVLVTAIVVSQRRFVKSVYTAYIRGRA